MPLTSFAYLLGAIFLLSTPNSMAADVGTSAGPPAVTPSAGLEVVWSASGPVQTLKALSEADLKHIRKLSSSEVDPKTGKRAHWEGISLSDLIEQTLKGFPVDRKAQIDLIVLKNAKGQEAVIPRSFLTKYPVLLASRKDHKSLGGFESVPPWTSRSKTRSEGLPLETYFLNGVTQVELANLFERYGSIYLKNRQDPLSLRGEKIFTQNCLGCHGGTKGEKGIEEARKPLTEHPDVKGAPKLSKRDLRALRSYLEIYEAENSPRAAATTANVSK
jgi:hypothetical protein